MGGGTAGAPGHRPVTVAVLVDDASAPALVRASGERLAGLGLSVATVADDGGLAAVLRSVAAELARADDAVLLVSSRLVVPAAALSELVDDPRAGTSVLVGAGRGLPQDVLIRRGRVVDAGSAMHATPGAGTSGCGVLQVGGRDLAAAAEAVAGMAAVAGRLGWRGEPMPFVLVALVRSGLVVRAVDVDGWPWERPATESELRAAEAGMAAMRTDDIRFRRATRPDDGFYSTFVLRRLSRRITPVALRLGVTPNQITAASFAVGLGAAACFAGGARGWLVAGAVLMQVSLLADCVDGEVARYTRRFTPFGAWLDAATDRVKEYACYAGLALGAGPDTDRAAWALAVAMVTLQTTRHMSDYNFTHAQVGREARPRTGAFDDLGAAASGASGGSTRAVQASERSNRRPAVRWAKRVLHLPIGERWLVLSLGAALGGPRVALATLLVLGCVGLAYTSAGRLVRASSWRREEPPERPAVAAQLDLALLPGARGLDAGRLTWALPAVLRLVELAVVAGVVAVRAPDALPLAFALMFVLAYHHYDSLYRVLGGGAVSELVRRAGLGVEVRVLVLLVAALVGESTLVAALYALTGWSLVVFGVVGTSQLVRSLPMTGQAARA